MASSEAASRLSLVISPALEKIIKNASWRKHSKLANECKSVLERFTSSSKASSPSSPSSPTGSEAEGSLPGPLNDGGPIEYSLVESESILSPLMNASSSGVLKIADPAVDCIQKLIAHGYLRGEADPSGGAEGKLLAKLIESVCKCHDLGDDALELLVLKALLSAVTSISLRIHGDCLLQIVKTCYDIYLDSKNVVNQTTAKASLIQMLVIVFRRMEADSSTVPVQPIVVAELMEPIEKADADGSMTQFVQGFITKIMQDIDGVLNPAIPGKVSIGAHDGAFETTTVETTNPADLLDSTDKDMLDAKYWEISMYKTALEGRKGELADGEGERDDDLEVQIGNKLRRDAFLVFRALCKLSMKTPPKEAMADPQLMKGKIVALELLKILLENAGAVFRTSERFLGAIKQYLCLSLLKNSASTLMIIFQLSCSIFISLVSRFRAGLKAEIGVFFPMIVLRVLENVAQPNFQQKMIVLRFVEKLCVDSQILVDIFINYDCDVNSSNIFERMVNGLLKTAQGVPPGVATTLLPPQELTMKLESMKCLVAILKSMGDWLNKQLRIPDPHSTKKIEVAENSSEAVSVPMSNGTSDEHGEGSDSHSEVSTESSEVLTIEQRRAYKLELQEGISLFNRKPKKGIEFLINANKVGSSPEEIAAFLKDASGLDKALIGDYLGEREDLSLKVMHAYVDSFDFRGLEFDEAIRVFLKGFRLPGEAQKIDRIMEKFAERYCKCNPKAFISADTAYVLAYSVILLNTDAHNPMVKNKMSAEDFIRNNRGIDDGKDLPEEYLKSLYERISRNEIKMKDDELAPQQKQSTNSNKLLGFDSILNIVIRKRGEDQNMETSDDLIRHMQEQFKEKARKTESVYYAATDVVILRFMIEVCWAPMLAAFSVPLDRSDDDVVIALCLEGFQYAIHVTAVMSMKTHRDAFVTSLAKFTSLHSPADIKQKNIDAIKAIVKIADEEGNFLQEAWEHILTCVSRFEHLHLLGEGAPPDATFFAFPQNESEKSKQTKGTMLPLLKKKGLGRIQYAAAAVMRGSYDSAGITGNASGVTSEQMNNLVSNLNMLEQVGSSEMNRIFTRSQKLNSEAIVDFVKALCKVSVEELRSTSDPRVFSLTKIVEIAHYNMNRIRLVWSSIWHVLSDFFVTIGCSENLSIAIFAMDSLRQLSMKFLDREELANYNFQNEFMKPFVIVMRKSSAVEIRELIIRCVSQMVLSRVNNVKSGWKSMFMVFTTAAYDDHKNIVLLAFEIIEKIIRDYFPYITETETTTFTDCVNCLIAFTNNRFNKDISLNAIAFLRFCATKLAEGDLGFSSRNKDKELAGKSSSLSPRRAKDGKHDAEMTDKDNHLYFWFPLLAGLSELSFDPRPEIRKSALQVLFDTLRKHGHLFSLPLWERVFESVLFPIFDYVRHAIDPSSASSSEQGMDSENGELDQDAWLYETCTLALQLVVDLFVKFYSTVNPLLKKVLTLLVSFIKRPHQSLAGIGIAAFVRLMSNAGDLFSEEKWQEVVFSLKEATTATLPDFTFLVDSDSTIRSHRIELKGEGNAESNGSELPYDDSESLTVQHVYTSISDAKCRAAVQLLLIQAVMEIYNMYRSHLSTKNVLVLFDALHSVASHAHNINASSAIRSKLQEFASITQMQDPPLLRLENESYQICLTFVQNLIVDGPHDYEEAEVESCLTKLCHEVLQFYIETARYGNVAEASVSSGTQPHWPIPLGSGKRRELAARAPLIVAILQAICNLNEASFEKNLAGFFPLLSSLISCEHGSNEVQAALSDMLSTTVGPILLRSC
ncbi:brefeldin A-inhibited guanine nucleotide-exchange protein 2-like [Cucurbita moschata]|uniref:Brefeldin A-inhibited guanine nucleotide-exchange protein 2-like n=1 Tax=Cucurbita moschata TaxID=3662 RepID=A0A6J1F2G4_CUCMO|nr:brefeldin A-inhibited guanine nucleotide-exchange protein 2-like [Cucurbita moschata]XP_022934342.1 brefeldin A-inhibited guanine nucleotide-exchange protein 2-like [Cucurbita moschata]XP_022934350.1 brefeldin A-inhibited guanine nucleotide-exchange protein 2-like [Cucurbita moschata]